MEGWIWSKVLIELYLGGIVLKRSWGGEVKNVLVLEAVAVGQDGYRRILGVVEGHKEDKAGWRFSTAQRTGPYKVFWLRTTCLGLSGNPSYYRVPNGSL